MRVRLTVVVLVLYAAAEVWSSPDIYAAGAGGTQPVNLNAATQAGAYGNPALLGLDRTPRAGLSFLPMSIGVWSDELALASLYNKYLLEEDWARYLTLFFYESFDLRDVKNNPDLVSRKLTEGMKDGVGIYFGYQVSPFVLSMNGFSVGLRTYVDFEARLPGGILLPFFSAEEGLRRGGKLDFSTLNVNMIAATELAVKLGRPMNTLPSFFDYLKLDRGAYGVGIKHILGHSYFSVNADNGSEIEYDSVANIYRITMNIDAISVGTGLSKNWAFSSGSHYWDSTFLRQPVVGEGWGFDVGAIFHNDNHFISIDIQDIGMILWDGRKIQRTTGTYTDNLDLGALLDLDKFIDDMRKNQDLVDDTSGRNHISYLPMSLNLGYTYYYDLSDMAYLKYLTRYLTANAGLKQQIITGPGKNTIVPTLSLGASAGLINGFLPLRYGVIFGGPGEMSSAVSAGVNMRYLSIDACYKAVGHPFLLAKKGFEAAAALTVNWGWREKKKLVGDIIPNTEVFIQESAPDTEVAFAQDKPKIAVYVTDGGDKSMAFKMLATLGAHKVVGNGLAKAIGALGNSDAVNLTGDITKGYGEAVGEAQAADIGRQFGVQYLCIVAISNVKGKTFTLGVRLVDVANSQAIANAGAPVDLSNGPGMLQALGNIAKELVIGMASSAVQSVVQEAMDKAAPLPHEPVPAASHEPVPAAPHEPVPTATHEPVPAVPHEPVPVAPHELIPAAPLPVPVPIPAPAPVHESSAVEAAPAMTSEEN